MNTLYSGKAQNMRDVWQAVQSMSADEWRQLAAMLDRYAAYRQYSPTLLGVATAIEYATWDAEDQEKGDE